MKKSLILIGLGILNITHAGLHILQFVQSFILLKASLTEEDHELDNITHNPYLAIVWCITGLFTLYMGVKDFQHHRNHKD